MPCYMLTLPTLKLGSQGPYVKQLKMNLNGLAKNYNNFIIDKIYDSKIEDVVKNYQDDNKLVRDGIVGPATWNVIIQNIKQIQAKLSSLGYLAGGPDGSFGPNTTDAVKRFQRDHGLIQEGVVNPRTRVKLFNPRPMGYIINRPSSTDLSSLDPYVASLAREFLRLTKANNLDVRIIAGFRSWDESDRLYAQGRTAPGPIVTNARGGESYHNWGLAFDAAPFEFNMVTKDIAKFKQMGSLGERVGLQWGGTFKDIVDLPHFQYTFGLSIQDLLDGKLPPK